MPAYYCYPKKVLLARLEPGHGLQREDVERVLAAFKRHDADFDGLLSSRGFEAVVRKLGEIHGVSYGEVEMEEMKRHADSNFDGQVGSHDGYAVVTWWLCGGYMAMK